MSQSALLYNVFSNWYQSRWLALSYLKADSSPGCFSGNKVPGSWKSSWEADYLLELLDLLHWIFSLNYRPDLHLQTGL